MVRLTEGRWLAKKEHGGLILDAGVHKFYLYKWLYGGVKDIRAIVWNSLKNQEVEDNVVLMGKLENGARFVLRLSNTAEKPWREQIEIQGSKGVIFGDQLLNPPLRAWIGSGYVNIEGSYNELIVKEVPYEPDTWKSDSMIEEVNHFIDCVINDKEPLVDPMDAAYAVKVAEMARKTILDVLT